MFRFEADLKVFVHREPIDFRAGINGLVMLVSWSRSHARCANARDFFAVYGR